MLPLVKQPVHWPNTLFLCGTLLATVVGVPLFAWNFGVSAFQMALFAIFFAATGLSITLGYHRLFSHMSFHARWPVRLFTLIFGAAAFENSALAWAADHRSHHKHVDHDEDPYDISKGFFHAHLGWILFRQKLVVSLGIVKDLERDALVQWQHRHYKLIAVAFGFGLPVLLGWAVGGWTEAWASFLIAGVARVVCVHHFTFFINSLCHTLGRQPYSSGCTARDSALMAWFTFGEGYHNFHHAFQHDYRNGVKWWQFDPTKWSIWLLHQLGLASNLRRVPEEKILLAEVEETQLRIDLHTHSTAAAVSDSLNSMLLHAQQRLQKALVHWQERKADYARAAQMRLDISREKLAQLRREVRRAHLRLRLALHELKQLADPRLTRSSR